MVRLKGRKIDNNSLWERDRSAGSNEGQSEQSGKSYLIISITPMFVNDFLCITIANSGGGPYDADLRMSSSLTFFCDQWFAQAIGHWFVADMFEWGVCSTCWRRFECSI